MKRLLLLPLAVVMVGAEQRDPAKGEMGFVLTEFTSAIYQGGAADCPNGLAGTIRENYLQHVNAAERERLNRKENESELKTLWQGWSLGPKNTNLCANPEAFPDRGPQSMFEGKVARGLDLDGGKSACHHTEFAGPQGEKGIDNQAYRAMGCARNYRGVDGTAGDVVKGFNMRLATGEQSIVLLMRGVDSIENDDAVEVILASTNDRPVIDSKQNILSGTSFSIHANPAWRNVLKGAIVNGVLTTEAKNIQLDRKFGHGGRMGERAEWFLNGGKLQLRFQPDGSVRGLLGAYQTPHNILLSTITGGIGAALVAGIDCAAQYNTLMKLADGGRDPKTGKCTMNSVALDVAAVPAFVFDRPQAAAK